jgi:uncharacterized protein (UPF0371 family)
MKIIVDIMSGDKALLEQLLGAHQAAVENPAVEMVFVGNEAIIRAIAHMKQDILKVGYTSLNLDEALIGLAISSTTNPAAQIAMEKLDELRGCEVHMTHMVTPGDEAGLRRIGCRYTSDPIYATNTLFTGRC